MNLKNHIRTVRGWPIPEVNFRDVSTLFENSDAFRSMIDSFSAIAKENNITKLAGIDARGFILAGGVSTRTSIPMLMIRKKGKLPPPTLSESYELEYGEASIELREGACEPGDRVLLLDDLIATGGTLIAAAKLVERQKASASVIAAIVDLPELGGSEKLRKLGYSVQSLCSFTEAE